MLNDREISHTELIQETFLNIKNNSELNAFITLNEEESIKKANNLDNMPDSGSLAGIPIAQKDLFCTKDLKTTCGSNMLSNFIPPYSATVIENLENAGCISVGMTSLLARFTIIREDASLASLYLISLALGIFILSAAGSAVPLKSFLFGSILGMDDATLYLIGATATVTLVSFAVILRPLITSTIDPVFHESQSSRPGLVVHWFMFLVVLNLLGAFKALGTLMAVGLMILPATAARYWVSTLTGYLVVTFLFALTSCWAGLILSFYVANVPSGPAIILVSGVIFFVSVLFAPQGFGFLRYRRMPFSQ